MVCPSAVSLSQLQLTKEGVGTCVDVVTVCEGYESDAEEEILTVSLATTCPSSASGEERGNDLAVEGEESGI